MVLYSIDLGLPGKELANSLPGKQLQSESSDNFNLSENNILQSRSLFHREFEKLKAGLPRSGGTKGRTGFPAFSRNRPGLPGSNRYLEKQQVSLDSFKKFGIIGV
jgi:hypothetical protein